MSGLRTNRTFRPKAHKEENDPGSHSLSIGSQAEKEGKVETAETGGRGRLGGGKKLKILQHYVMSFDTSRWKRWKSYAINQWGCSAVVPWSGQSQRTTCVILVPIKHSFRGGTGNVDCCRSRTPGPLQFDPVRV